MIGLHSFDSIYVYESQMHLAIVFDYLAYSCDLTNEKIEQIMRKSKKIALFCYGHPSLIAGLSGIELAKQISEEFQVVEKREYTFPFEKSIYYWAGYFLAYYSWYTCKPLKYIFSSTDLTTILDMYSCYHEMDIMHFVEDFDKIVSKGMKESNLKLLRLLNNFSQSELAKKSGVSLRSIQLYEQRVNDINKAQAGSLYKLAKTLNRSIEDLLEN